MKFKKKMEKKYYLLLFVLPLFLVLTALFLNDARGPYWLGSNLDPEYVYLLNAANLAGWKGVGHIDHPGTPVQVLGAITLRVVHFSQPSIDVDLHTDVLKRPEYYLNAINTVMVALNALMLLLLGILTYTLIRNIWLSLWLQLAPFFSVTLLQFGLTRVNPEPLLFFSSLLMIVLLVLKIYTNKDSTQPENIMIILILGIISGFGIACKVTFIPLVVIPLIIFPKLKNKVFYLLVVGISFVIFTLPIIRMYPRFFDWVYNLLTHSGRYGSGPSGLFASQQYLKNIIKLLSGNPFFSIALLLSLVILTVVFLIPKLRKISIPDIHFKLLAAVAAAQVVGLLMVSKHSADHYLLPLLNLSGFSLFLVYLSLKYVFTNYKINLKYLTVPFVLFLAFMFIVINPPRQIKKTVIRLTKLKEKSLVIHQEVKNNYKDYAKIYYYRSSSPEYALKFGSDLSRSYHAKRLEELYKGVYFYDIWTKRFSNFDYNQKIPFEKIRSKHGDKIIFQGPRRIKFPGIQLKKVTDYPFYERIFVME